MGDDGVHVPEPRSIGLREKNAPNRLVRHGASGDETIGEFFQITTESGDVPLRAL